MGQVIPVSAQTGPGGVGSTDGTSNLRIWLDADDGVSPSTNGSTVTDWINRAGTTDPSTINGDPTFQSEVIGGRPAIGFDGDDEFVFDGTQPSGNSLNDLPDGNNTLIAVSANSGEQLNQNIVGVGAIGANGAPEGRGLLYELDNQTADIDIVLAAISGDPKGTGGKGDFLDSGAKAVSTTYNTTPFSIYSSIVAGGNQDLLANGEFLDDGDASTGFDGPVVGERLQGDIAEVIAVDRRLNAAELTLVHNYLSTKYGIGLSGGVSDLYSLDDGYGGDVAGIGTAGSAIRNAPAGNQTVAQSSGLRLERGSALPDGEYVLYGHDEANFSFSSNDLPNGRSNLQRLDREWRVDMTNRSSLSGVTMGFDESTLDDGEKLSAGSYNDYFLYVDDDGDFSDGDAVAYDLEEQGGGLYTNPSVNIDDGDYVTVAQVQRTVTFVKAFESGFEDVAGSVSVSVSVNFKNSTSLSLPYNVANGTPSPTRGDDYSVNTGSFSIPAGATSGSASPFTVLDDEVSEENTEFVEVSFGSLPSIVGAGGTTLFEYGILDDENSRTIDFADSSPSSVQEGNTGTKTQTFTVTLPDGMTGPATVTYRTTGSATAGEDYDIVSESDPAATSGTVTIPDGSQTGSFDIDVLGDKIDEGNDESFTIDLIAVENGTLDPNGTLSTTFTITDDDPIPEVQFAAADFSGSEGTSVDVVVELEEVSQQDLDVTIQDDGTGAATAGSDYTFPDDNTITISAGERQGALSVPLNNDSEVETSETIDVSIADAGTDAPLAATTTSATVSILDASGLGATGPGGVGGAESVRLWLRADEGISASGGSVSSWDDQSGNNHDATQSTSAEQPAFGTTTINGIDVVTFDGTDDFLRAKDVADTLPAGNNTLFAAGSANAAGAVLGIDDSDFNPLRTLEYTDGSTAGASQGGTTVTTGGADGTAVSSSAFDGDVSIAVNGGASSTTGGSTSADGVYASVGAELRNAGDAQDPDPVAEAPLDGNLGEVIAYDVRLNRAQELIVTNYLGAKYGLSSLATDLYDGDSQGGAADRDTDVLGVGQAADGSRHIRAEGGGFVLSVRSGLDDGEFVLAGRKIGVEKRVNYSDVSGVSGLAARLNDDRYLDITDTDGITVDLSFDFSEFGVGDVAGDVSDYVLIRRGGTSGDWSEVAVGGVSVSGDVVTFTGVSLTDADDGYYTIGTTDGINSPLLNRWGRTVTGTSGADGADAGWRFVGVPVQGATIDDLQPPVSPSRNGFVTHSVAMDYHWSLDDGGSNTDSWTELNSGDPIPNGRGFIVYLYDDQYYPLDPEIPLDVEPNNGTPGDQNVTVGDDTPAFDTALNTDSTWHLLANPYAQSFDLSQLNLGTDSDGDGSGDFQSAVQIWDPSNPGYVLKESTLGDKVAPWQAFFVERMDVDAGAAETLTFDKAGRTSGASFIGSKASPTAHRSIGLTVEAHSETGEGIARDESAKLFFHPEAERGRDRYDASKLTPFAQTYVALAPVGTKSGEPVLRARESLPYTLDQPIEVPMELRVRNLDPAELRLSVSEWTSVPDRWAVTVIDTKGTADPSDDEEVQWGADSSYVFTSAGTKQKKAPSTEDERTATASRQSPSAAGARRKGPPKVEALSPRSEAVGPRESGSAVSRSKETTSRDTARFVVRIDPEGGKTLPVEMAEMKAQTDEESVVLQWATASETNNAGFYVEHQRLASDTAATPAPDAWRRDGFVEGEGTTDAPQQYRHRVKSLDYGRHAFRLRQVDTDGTETYTEVVETELRLEKSYSVEAPYPNPARRRSTLELTVRQSQPLRVEMYDVLGRRVRIVSDTEVSGQQTRKVQIQTRDLSSGVYFLRVKGEDFSETRRLTVVQ